MSLTTIKLYNLKDKKLLKNFKKTAKIPKNSFYNYNFQTFILTNVNPYLSGLKTKIQKFTIKKLNKPSFIRKINTKALFSLPNLKIKINSKAIL